VHIAVVGYLARFQALSMEDFAAQEPGVVLGADYRFAREWKVADEVVFSPSLGVLPAHSAVSSPKVHH
jgi:hypothetical protein